ncbi:MAG: alpha-N-arabinofuranosidase [Bacteroidales bacterium]|nr:alpha-N-arabinofuranosidase [Bacteroidales bacterium]
MKKALLAAAIFLAAATSASAKGSASVSVEWNPFSTDTIMPEIYGQFAEHLGTCIYGGLWVGPDSDIPNTDGYRNDVLDALRQLHIPVMRWPGGCFADEYHWMDGIGPKAGRPRMVNNNWGGTVEDNSFGTHEFFNLCELLGCEPYLSGNVGSGTVEELAKWVEYITAEDGPMATLRKKNGRQKPWHLKYLGVGNESWGCGGDMLPEYYADLFRRYGVYCRNYDGNRLFKIASGASDYDYRWTEVLMKKAASKMDGISLHYYTVFSWSEPKGSAIDFTADQYYWALAKCLEIEKVIKHHATIMDVYDPSKRVALMVDEWGTWWDEEPGSIKGHLYQQNSMRDAMVAALSLNVFHKFTDRVRMANIAQVANVLQSMVLTKGPEMVLTPTYYVFKMYAPHQGARVLPLDIKCDSRQVPSERSSKPRTLPTVSATASEKDGVITISLTNVDLKEACEVNIPVESLKVKSVSGEILTAPDMTAYNDFGKPEAVTLKPFNGAKTTSGTLKVDLPAMSIVTLTLQK